MAWPGWPCKTRSDPRPCAAARHMARQRAADCVAARGSPSTTACWFLSDSMRCSRPSSLGGVPKNPWPNARRARLANSTIRNKERINRRWERTGSQCKPCARPIELSRAPPEGLDRGIFTTTSGRCAAELSRRPPPAAPRTMRVSLNRPSAALPPGQMTWGRASWPYSWSCAASGGAHRD